MRAPCPVRMQAVKNTRIILRFTALALAICLLGVTAVVCADETQSEPQQVLNFLNQTIEWYRQLASQQQLANQPTDVIFLNQNRQLADQVLQLAFDFARARAQAITAAAEGTPNAASEAQ